VKYNNVPVSNYTYDGFNLSYSAALNNGSNTLEISATNSDGNDIKTATVIYRQKVALRPPVVNIINPTSVPTVTFSNYNFEFTATNVVKSQVQVFLNGNPVSIFKFVAPSGSFIENLVAGTNTVTVIATNNDGTDTKTETIIYVMQEEINPTHTEPTGTSTPTTTTTTTTTTDTTSNKITICHIPPGNNQNPQTISIPLSAWPAHKAHGDSLGACPVQKINGIKVTPKINTGNPINENKPTEQKQDTLNKQPLTPRRPR
jgi:PKD repeat protein